MKEVREISSQREQHMQRHRGTCTIILRWLGKNMHFFNIFIGV